MKLIIEIKDGLFIWDYEIGSSKQHGETPLTADALVDFANILRTTVSAYKYNDEKDYSE